MDLVGPAVLIQLRSKFDSWQEDNPRQKWRGFFIYTCMKSPDEIVQFIMFRKIFKLSDLKLIKENDIAYLSIKLSSRKVRFSIDEVITPNILPEEEVKKFIAKTNPYISKEKDIRKYTKKANALFLVKEKLSEIYDQMVKPSYYLVFDEKTNKFVKGEDLPEWYRKQNLRDTETNIRPQDPVVCWSEDDAQKVLQFMANPFEEMGISHSLCIRAYNSENDLLEEGE